MTDYKETRSVNYKPAIKVKDFSSKGLSSQVRGWKTGRVHHFFSDLELQFFFILEWSTIVTDIREQFALPLDETISIAEKCHLKHPVKPSSQNPTLITTDFGKLLGKVRDRTKKI